MPLCTGTEYLLLWVDLGLGLLGHVLILGLHLSWTVRLLHGAVSSALQRCTELTLAPSPHQHSAGNIMAVNCLVGPFPFPLSFLYWARNPGHHTFRHVLCTELCHQPIANIRSFYYVICEELKKTVQILQAVPSCLKHWNRYFSIFCIRIVWVIWGNNKKQLSNGERLNIFV